MNQSSTMIERDTPISMGEVDNEDEIEKCRKNFGNNHPDTVIALNKIGNTYLLNHRYDLAENCYNEALRIIKKLKPEAYRDIALIMAKIAEVYLQKRNFSKALHYFNEAYDTLNLGEDDTCEIAQPEVLLNIGRVYEENEELTESLNYYEDSLEMAHGIMGDRHPFLARVLNHIGRNLLKQGNYAESNYMFSKAFQFLKEAYGPKSIELAETMENLARVSSLQDSHEKAIDTYNEVLLLKTEYYGKVDHRLAETLINIGRMKKNQGKIEEAMKYYVEAAKLTKLFLGEWHVRHGECLTHVGVLQRRTGDYDTALKTFKGVKNIFSKYGLPINHPSFVRVLRNLQEITYEERESTDLREKPIRKVTFSIPEISSPIDKGFSIPEISSPIDKGKENKQEQKKKPKKKKTEKTKKGDHIQLFDRLDDIVD